MMTFAQFFQGNLFLFLLLAASVTATVVYELRHRDSAGKQVGPSAAAQLVNRGGLLIDIRTSAEYKKGHISGAKNIPAEHFTQKMDKKQHDTNQTIVLVDGNGMEVKTHAKWLCEQGYSAVYILSGGMATWAEENLPLVK